MLFIRHNHKHAGLQGGQKWMRVVAEESAWHLSGSKTWMVSRYDTVASALS